MMNLILSIVSLIVTIGFAGVIFITASFQLDATGHSDFSYWPVAIPGFFFVLFFAGWYFGW